MSVEYQIDSVRRLVRVTLRGRLTGDELLKFQREVWSRPEVQGFDELVDASGIELDISSRLTSDLRGLAEIAASMDSPSASKLAIVASDDFGFGLGRMYATYREATAQGTRAVEVFREMEPALAWLDGVGERGP